VDAALWYWGTRAQKYAVKKFFLEQRKYRGNRERGGELNDPAQ
jgi:hypothetical protein